MVVPRRKKVDDRTKRVPVGVGGCQTLWTVVDGCGWLRMVVDGCGGLWRAVEGYGLL